ncbi:MAG: hypothetical protein M3Z04_12980 [Chloroflexota bacterium]|nr:hypothetical protein [Chloroflexota bacterium]
MPLAGEENIAEEGMDTYLQDLEDYEARLARGEIQWEPPQGEGNAS